MSKVVLAHGCFDLLHLGHIKHLQAAKGLGDRLIVSITPDEFVNKGKGRPVFTLSQRMEVLASLECVDVVIVSHGTNAIKSILSIKPDIFVKGQDYADSKDYNLVLERECVESIGGKFIILSTEPLFSSTELLDGTYLKTKCKCRGVGEGQLGIE